MLLKCMERLPDHKHSIKAYRSNSKGNTLKKKARIIGKKSFLSYVILVENKNFLCLRRLYGV